MNCCTENHAQKTSYATSWAEWPKYVVRHLAALPRQKTWQIRERSSILHTTTSLIAGRNFASQLLSPEHQLSSTHLGFAHIELWFHGNIPELLGRIAGLGEAAVASGQPRPYNTCFHGRWWDEWGLDTACCSCSLVWPNGSDLVINSSSRRLCLESFEISTVDRQRFCWQESPSWIELDLRKSCEKKQRNR